MNVVWKFGLGTFLRKVAMSPSTSTWESVPLVGIDFVGE